MILKHTSTAKPFPPMNTISQVHLIDCMEFMATLPDNFFDLAVVDPPYGIGIGTMNYTTSGAIRPGRNSLAKRRDYRKRGDWDNKRPDQDYFTELLRTSKHQIIWGGNYYSDLLPPSKSFIIWDKKTDDKYSNDFADCEMAWCSIGVARIFRYLWHGMLQQNMSNKEDRFHPTQKPVALYKWILKNYAKPGDKIFDSHMGSQSSRIAAYDMNFDYWGCEIDKDYFEAGNKRFENFIKQQKLQLD
jgi:site-specific DNA-methyltransferase (adenine-specific)